MKSRAIMIAALALAAAFLPAEARHATLAFLGTANTGGDPRYDYLEPLVSGLLLYDLSSTEGIALADRAMLQDVLREQELSVNLGKGDAAKLGGILGAEWVARAEYSVMGQELSLSLTLVEVETSQAFVFADRGSDENLVHGLAEKAVKKLLGTEASFRSDQRERSLLSLRDVKPGSVSLYCPLIDAQVFLDGSFAAYGTGDPRKPLALEGVDPGKHLLSIKLDGFGAVKLPEVAFVDWQQTVEVLPGKNLVVKADARAYSEWYYALVRLADESFKLPGGQGKDSRELRKTYPFTDRQGASRPISLGAAATRDAKGGRVAGEIAMDGKSLPFSLACAEGKDASAEFAIGPAKLGVSIDLGSAARNDFRLRIERTDIEFGEWDRER